MLPPWTWSPAEALRALDAREAGLTSAEAERRLAGAGRNEVVPVRRLSVLRLLWGQVSSPLVLLLVVAAVVSIVAAEWVDAAMALGVVLASSLLGFWREYDAGQAIERLKARVVPRSAALRDGRVQQVETASLVPGDVVQLSAGTLVPADCVVLEATHLSVNQAVLTGETLAAEKRPGPVEARAPLAERHGMLYFGTNVRSGAGRALVVATGAATVFGGIARKLQLRPPETDFDRGLRRFGQLLMRTMTVMILVVLGVNLLVHRDVFEALLFAIALAVGLAPELLPAVLSVNLARSAQAMARHGVLVRRLNAIENFGSMDVLCTDKTGTLTRGELSVERAVDPQGAPSPRVLEEAALNAHFESGLTNPLDEAILAARQPALEGVEKVGELPYDFVRKRLSVVVRQGGRCRLITKGAVGQVLAVCTRAVGGAPLDGALRASVAARLEEWGALGLRVIAVATRELDEGTGSAQVADERDLELAGLLAFADLPKEGVAEAVAQLVEAGVALKIISGDSRAVTVHVARQVGLAGDEVLTGAQLDELSDESLWARVESTTLFAEVDPNQKERIILALKKRGHVVGYMGDGINDAPALHAADVSVSVEGAVDVARDAADFVLVERRLEVLRQGVLEGRTTFANTLKYILTTESANLGNMLSMALCSAFLPFLPLLAGQVLLNNLLSDVPAMALANDAVDPELVARPRRWDLGFVRRFMVQFGLLSSVFDLATFGLLLWVFRAGEAEFRTGWFVESLLTELAVALVVRTRRPFWASRPATSLVGLTLLVGAVDLALPYLPFAPWLGFTPLPWPLLAAVVGLTALYVAGAEVLKRRFFAREG